MTTADGGAEVGDGAAAPTEASAAISTKLICSYGIVTPRDLQRTCKWLIHCLRTEGAELAAGAETEAALSELRTVIGDVLPVR